MKVAFYKKRNLWRLWIVLTAAWVIGLGLVNAQYISYWLGYHYGLMQEHGAIGPALAEKSQTKAVIAACRSAEREICPSFRGTASGSYRNEYEELLAEREVCRRSEAFLNELVAEAKSRGFKDTSAIRNGEACDLFFGMRVPEVNWTLMIFAISLPAIPPLLFILGHWAVKGFRGDAE